MSTETAKINYAAHQIILNARERLEIRGVTEVVSFDETYVMLKTQCGDMAIDGKDLKIAVLEIDTGIVVLSGTVSGVYYSEPQSKEKRSFVKRLFS